MVAGSSVVEHFVLLFAVPSDINIYFLAFKTVCHKLYLLCATRAKTDRPEDVSHQPTANLARICFI